MVAPEAAAAVVDKLAKDEETEAKAKPVTVRGDYGSSSSIRKTWKFEVTDSNEVPRQYMSINEIAVRAAIREGARDIPGLRIFLDESVVIR